MVPMKWTVSPLHGLMPKLSSGMVDMECSATWLSAARAGAFSAVGLVSAPQPIRSAARMGAAGRGSAFMVTPGRWEEEVCGLEGAESLRPLVPVYLFAHSQPEKRHRRAAVATPWSGRHLTRTSPICTRQVTPTMSSPASTGAGSHGREITDLLLQLRSGDAA